MAKRYRLRLKRLDFISAVDAGAQGDIANVALIKRNDPDAIEAICQVQKLDESLGLVWGWACATTLDGGVTPHVDYQDDAITGYDDLIKVAAEFMAGAAASDVMHDGDVDGKIVFAMPLVPEVNDALGIKSDVHGLAIAMKPSAETFKRFVSGELKAFSIAGAGERTEMEKRNPTAVAKRAALTTAVLGHSHVLHGIDDSVAGSTSYDSLHVEGHSHDHYTGHSHSWIRNEDGSITVGESMGHSHELGAMSASLAKGGARKSTAAAPAPTVASQPRNNMTTDAQKIADLEKQIASLTKSLTIEKQCSTLDDAARAHYATLTGAAAEAFLAKSEADRAADVAKVNEVVYTSTSTGAVYRKRDDNRLVEMAKRDDAREVELAKAREATEQASFEKRADADLKHFTKGLDVRSYIVKAITKGGGDQKMVDEAIEALKGADAALKMLAGARGVNPEDSPEEGDVLKAFNAGLDEFAKSVGAKHSYDAYEAFVKTDKGKALKAAYNETIGK